MVALVAACSSTPEVTPIIRVASATATSTTIPPTETPEPTATVSPTLTPEPTIAPTRTPTMAPTKEAVQEVPCGILPVEYCSQAEVVNIKLPTGGTVKMIGFRLPPGVPLFLPKDGQVTKTKLVNATFYRGYQAYIFDPDNPDKSRFKLSGDLLFDNMLSLNMKKGERFGQTQNTEDIDMIGYNLIVNVVDIIGTDRREASNEETLRKMFPAINF